MGTKANAIDEWIGRYLREEEPRSKSLMISVFGDSIAPYADGIWLGQFIELMKPLGVNERLVRTSAFRLIEEGWLSARRDGRRSYYALTESGRQRFESAYGHVYAAPPETWDQCWTTVVLPRNGETSGDRSDLKKELEWSGFAVLTPGVLVHPGIAPGDVAELVKRYGLQDQAIVLRSRAAAEAGADAINAALLSCWDLSEVQARYQRFVSIFMQLMPKLAATDLTPAQAFQVQTLLIHSFRRASLHDPRLPTQMLPHNWAGRTAYELCREVYARTVGATRRHLRSLPGFEITDIRGGRLSMSVGERFAVGGRG